MVWVRCHWCNKLISRSPSSLARVTNVFCSRYCKNCFEQMKREAVKQAEEEVRLSVEFNHEMDCCKESYRGGG